MNRGKAKQSPVALGPVLLDPTYELELAGKDAWPVLHLAFVAIGQPIKAEDGRSARKVQMRLAAAVRNGALSAVEVKQPTPEVRERVHEEPWVTRHDPLPFQTAYRTRVVRREASYWHLATVQPADAAAFLRTISLADMAARVEVVAKHLRERAASAPGHETPLPGDWPANLSKCSDADVRAVIAAAWARCDPKRSAGYRETILEGLKAGGFKTRAATAWHAQTVPKWYRPGNRKLASSA